MQFSQLGIIINHGSYENWKTSLGLYLNRPEHTLVLVVDEKSQIQALDRTQPGLPLRHGPSQTMTHNYKHNGTALCLPLSTRPTVRSTGFVKNGVDTRNGSSFLRLLDQALPGHCDLHLIGDNYATHKHPKVQRCSSSIPGSTCTSGPPVRPG